MTNILSNDCVKSSFGICFKIEPIETWWKWWTACKWENVELSV